MKPQDKIDLYMIIRNIKHRYNLDQFEDQAISEIMKPVEQARRETIAELDNIYGELTWSDERNMRLLNELDQLTVGIKNRLGEDVSEVARISYEQSVEAHNSIMSIGGRAANVSTVQLSAEQIQAFLSTPMGGMQLSEWVQRTFDYPVQERLGQELGAGLFRGESYRKLSKRIDELLGDAAHNADTLVRSWVQASNVEAQHTVARQNDDLIKGWRWDATLENGNLSSGRGTCLRCLSLSAREEVYPLNGGPSIPLHPNCVLADTRVSAPGAMAAFRAEYNGPIIDITLDNGRTVSVTPNHGIMTDAGPVFAKTLKQGDKIVFDKGHADLSANKENNHGVPSKAGDLFDFFFERFKTLSVKPRRPAINLHGDAEFVNGNIDIVAPDSFLRGDIKTLFNYDLPDAFFPHADVGAVDLSSFCKSASVFVAMSLALQRLTGAPTVFEALGFGHNLKSFMRSFSIRPDGNIVFGKPSSDDALCGPELFRNSVATHADFVKSDDFINRQIKSMCDLITGIMENLCDFGFSTEMNALLNQDPFDWLPSKSGDFANFFLGFPGSVQLCDVSSVNVRNFSGHVFDLQSFSSVYYVEGMLSSNCRCIRQYVTKSYRELGIPLDDLDDAVRPYTVRGKVDPLTGAIKRGKTGTGGQPLLTAGKINGGMDSFFSELPEQLQRQTLGPGRYQLWKDGKIRLEDLANKNGKQKTLKQLKK
jgi:hypothetical protein